MTTCAEYEATVNHDAEPPEGDFYVTVRDGGKTGFLLGPFADIREALANVSRGSQLAQEYGPVQATFYAYGVSRLAYGTPTRTIFALDGSVAR